MILFDATRCVYDIEAGCPYVYYRAMRINNTHEVNKTSRAHTSE